MSFVNRILKAGEEALKDSIGPANVLRVSFHERNKKKQQQTQEKLNQVNKQEKLNEKHEEQEQKQQQQQAQQEQTPEKAPSNGDYIVIQKPYFLLVLIN